MADANAVGGGGRPGYSGIIFRSHPLVVCEREQILPGSAVSFAIDCVLPDRLPPTLRGVAMRYLYALVVAVKFPDLEEPRVVRVPFRVISAGGTAMDLERASDIIPVPTPRSVGPLPNRFLQHKDITPLTMSANLLKNSPPDDIEIALALSLNGRLTPYRSDCNQNRVLDGLQHDSFHFFKHLSLISAPKSLHHTPRHSNTSQQKKNLVPVYSITRGSASIARLHLPKRVHHLGDSISAIFHFQADHPCYRLGARVEAQEIIHPQFSIGQKPGTAEDPNEKRVLFRKVYGEHGEFVLSNRNTHVTFSIPHDAPPSFSTRVVTIRWLLHFVFLIPHRSSSPPPPKQTEQTPNGDEVRDPLLQNMKISSEESELSTEQVDIGWKGGAWSGEDPKNWTHLPQKNVDVLRWTLPIVVSGQPGSQWGTCSSGKIIHPSSVS